MDDVLEGRASPEIMETPARQERNEVPPGAPRKSKHQIEPQRKLRPKRLRYDLGVDEESPSTASKQELYALLESRINNTEGTWVQCCEAKCGKWRYLQDVADPNEVPDKWYCFMNKDPQYNSCTAAEQDMSQEELLDVRFFVGSIVWAKLASYPWWPAMVDDDPDSCIYFSNEDPYDEDRVTHYHVTFLDKNVTRAWIREDHCVPFHRDGCPKNKVPKQYERAFNDAVRRAEHAVKLTPSERIAEYCFVNNYPPLKKASRGRTLAKSKRPKKKSPKGEIQQVTSDTQTAKRPRGRPPKVRTATQEQTQQTLSASAATSHAGASQPASKKAKGTTAPSGSGPKPKVQSATATIKKTQERKSNVARQKTLQHQRPEKNAAGTAIIVQQLPQLVQPATAEMLREQPLVQPQVQAHVAVQSLMQPPEQGQGAVQLSEQPQEQARVGAKSLAQPQVQAQVAMQPLVQPQIQAQVAASVPAPNETLDLPLAQSLVTVPASCPYNDQELKTGQGQKRGPASPIQANQVADEADALPLPQRFDAATKTFCTLGQPKQVTGAPAMESRNGTQASSEATLLFTGGQTEENLEHVADINSLIQFIDEDMGKDHCPNDGTGRVTTAMAEAETDMVPASIATASGEPFSQLVLKGSATASAPLFGEASHSEQSNSAASNQMQSGTDFVPEVSPAKQVKQAAPKFFKTKVSSKEDKNKTQNKSQKEVNSKPKKTRNPSTKEPAADIAMPPSKDAATPAKPAKASVKAARKATASVKPTMAPANTTDKLATEAPAKPVMVPVKTPNEAAAKVPANPAMIPGKPTTVPARRPDKTATEIPAKQTTVPAKTTDQAAAVVPVKPATMVPARVSPEETRAPAKSAFKTGSMSTKQAAPNAPSHKKLFKVPTKESTSQPETNVTSKDVPAAKTNSQDQLNSSGSWKTLTEDSDFDALSSALCLGFEDSLSKSLSQSLDTDCDTDFTSLEAVDCSQSFDMEE